MPFIEIMSCGEDLTAANKNELTLQIGKVAQKKLDVQQKQLKMLIYEFSSENFYDGSKEESEDTEAMCIIRTHILKGRLIQQKHDYVNEVTNAVSTILALPKKDIRVFILELEPEHWGIAGTTVDVLRK